VVEEMVPEHLVLEEVIHALEILLKIFQGSLIIADLGIGKVAVVEHDSLYWEFHICFDLTELILIIDEHIFDDMWLVLLIVDYDVEKLLSEKIVWRLLV
jgi:hypothetical protein